MLPFPPHPVPATFPCHQRLRTPGKKKRKKSVRRRKTTMMMMTMMMTMTMMQRYL
jgi:hypothetical protein